MLLQGLATWTTSGEVPLRQTNSREIPSTTLGLEYDPLGSDNTR